MSGVWHAMFTVPNRKNETLTPRDDLVFCGSVYGEGIDAGVSVGLVHSFDIRIALRSFRVECHA